MSNPDEELAQKHQKILVAAAIIVVGMLVVISVHGVATDPTPNDPNHPDLWYMFIYRFQTLIGGLLAVGAAFITIRQMRKTDERADKRHEAFMELQIRPVKQGLEALDTKHSGTLIFCAFLLEDIFRVVMDNKGRDERELREALLHKCGGMKNVYRLLNEMFSDPSWDTYKINMSSKYQVSIDKLIHLLANESAILDPIMAQKEQITNVRFRANSILMNIQEIRMHISTMYFEMTGTNIVDETRVI